MLLTMQHGGFRIVANSQGIDLRSVLQGAFSDDLIERVATETGLIKRRRMFMPVIFFWALMSSILGGACGSIAAVKAEYERFSGHLLGKASFYRHFDRAMVEFLRALFVHACAKVFPPATTPPLLRKFTQTVLQDSTILRLRAKLAKLWPGAGMPAAAKVNVIVKAGAGGAFRVRVTKGTRAEVKFTPITRLLKGGLLIFDLGYQSLKNFARIEDKGGFFLTRLKDNLLPTIARSNLVHRGAAISLAGQPLREVLDKLRRTRLDVFVAIRFQAAGRWQTREWRVVGLRDDETGEYHLYLTNIPADRLTAEEIGQAYAYRWEIERLFAEFKGIYRLGSWAVTRDDAVLVGIYAVLIAWALTRRLRSALLTAEEAADPLLATQAAPLMRWGKVMAGHIHDIVTALLRHHRLPRSLNGLIREQVRDPNRGRVPLNGRTRRITRNARVTPRAA